MPSKTSHERMKEYRARLRRDGLRPAQVWVPDQRAPGFQEELERQVAQLDPRNENETLDFIAQTADWRD